MVLRCVLGLCTQKDVKSALPHQKPHCRKFPMTAFRYRIVRKGSHVLAILTVCVATRRVDVELADCRRGSPGAVQKVRRPKSGSARAAVVWDFAYGDASVGGKGRVRSVIVQDSTPYAVLSMGSNISLNRSYILLYSMGYIPSFSLLAPVLFGSCTSIWYGERLRDNADQAHLHDVVVFRRWMQFRC